MESTFFKKLRPSGLRIQLIIGVTAILVILIFLMAAVLMNRQKKFFLKLNYDRAFALSATLANTAEAYLASYELAGLQKLVSTYKTNPGVQYAFVTSDDGIVLAHTDKKHLGQKATDEISARLEPVKKTQVLVQNNSILDVATPVTDNDKIVGWVRIGLSQEYIQPNLDAIRNEGFLFILISIAAGTVFAFVVADRLSKGLQKLMTAAEKIKEGDRDIRVGPARSIEISELGKAFNLMLDDISANEKLLSMVLQNLPVGVWILDEKGNIKSVNKAGEEMWKGIHYVGVEDYNIYKAWFVDSGKEVEAREWGAALVLEKGLPVLDQEIEIECFDKTRKIVLNSAIPMRDSNDKITGVITINVDITGRKKAETAVKDQAETFSAIIENANESIFLLSPDCTVLQYNSPAKERIQLNSGKKVYPGANFKDFLYPGSENVFMPMFNHAVEGQYIERESFQPNIHGEMFWLRTKMYPIYDARTKLIGVTVLGENITQRKNAEEKVRQSEADYRQLFDNSPAPMWVIDEQTSGIKQVNRACIHNYGYSENEFLGMTIADLNPDKSTSLGTKMKNVFFMGSQRHTKKSGELIDVVTSSIPVNLNNEKSILMIGIDVTEKNLYEQKLTKAAIKAQEDERYEIGGELHDNVCQLLATSLLFLGMVKKNLPEGSIDTYDQTHRYISMATDEIRNLSHRLAPAFFDEETLEDALTTLLKTFNIENKYKISLSVDKDFKYYPMSHELQLNLYRILQEQLRNIMKHAQAKSIKVSLTMTDAGLQMKIADDGIGFDAKKSKGGIGLANMNRRVQLFSGNFTINSSVGKGCEALVDIPLPRPDEQIAEMGNKG